MKKSLFVLFMVAIGAIIFTGCKKDEDNDISTSLIGKWKLEKIEYIDVEDEDENDEDSYYYVFKENNVFEMIGEGAGIGTYSLSADGKTLTLISEGEGTMTATIKSITSNSLVLYMESIETSQEVGPGGEMGPIINITMKMEMTFRKES